MVEIEVLTVKIYNKEPKTPKAVLNWGELYN